MRSMHLKDYFFSLPMDQRKSLAQRSDTTYAHLKNVAYGGKECGIQLAVALERETRRAVTRQELRPNDWQQIWPELVKRRTRRVSQ